MKGMFELILHIDWCYLSESTSISVRKVAVVSDYVLFLFGFRSEMKVLLDDG